MVFGAAEDLVRQAEGAEGVLAADPGWFQPPGRADERNVCPGPRKNLVNGSEPGAGGRLAAPYGVARSHLSGCLRPRP